MPSFMEVLKVNGENMGLYVAVPEGAGPFPAVNIAFHVGGMDEFDKIMADRFAKEGYVAVVPDLFHRLSPEALAGPRLDRLGYLSDPEIIADMNAAADWLCTDRRVDNNRLGVTGFCMGGRIAWLMAAVDDRYQATVPFYGGHIMSPWGAADKSPFDLAAGINCPMLFHFGEIDGNPSQADLVKLDAELNRLGKEHTFHTYPGADHAFMDWTGARYNQPGAELAWPRTLEFFGKHL